VDTSAFGQYAKLFDGAEDLSVEELTLSFDLKLSQWPFSQGDRGRYTASCTCVRQPLRRSFATNSGSSSERMCSGHPFPHHYVGQCSNDLGRTPTPLGRDHQALPRGFIDQVQDAQTATS
jgi:hypothetical protein